MCQELARKTLILEIKLFDGKITYEPIPCYINENYQAVFSKSYSLSNWLPKTLEQISNKEYQQRVRESIRDFRREFYRFLAKNFYKYPSRCLFEIFLDFLKRRLCKIYCFGFSDLDYLKRSKGKLAGRIYEFVLLLLSFSEHLNFLGERISPPKDIFDLSQLREIYLKKERLVPLFFLILKVEDLLRSLRREMILKLESIQNQF